MDNLSHPSTGFVEDWIQQRLAQRDDPDFDVLRCKHCAGSGQEKCCACGQTRDCTQCEGFGEIDIEDINPNDPDDEKAIDVWRSLARHEYWVRYNADLEKLEEFKERQSPQHQPELL